jgi:hypothetical protein
MPIVSSQSPFRMKCNGTSSNQHGSALHRAPFRAWPRSRQQKQTKRQNSKKNSRLEPRLSPRAAPTQMSVNLDSLPWRNNGSLDRARFTVLFGLRDSIPRNVVDCAWASAGRPDVAYTGTNGITCHRNCYRYAGRAHCAHGGLRHDRAASRRNELPRRGCADNRDEPRSDVTRPSCIGREATY